jgi:hypothetical protein
MLTVQIQPQLAFANGKKMQATQFNVVSISDNLYDSVCFKYTLYDANMVWSGESTVSLEGREAYVTWDATATGAHKIVAAAIGLDIVDTALKLFEFEV